MKTLNSILAALLVLGGSAALAQGKDTAPTGPAARPPTTTVLAPVTVSSEAKHSNPAFSPFVWDAIGATGTIRTDIVRRWFSSETPSAADTSNTTAAKH